MLDVEVIDDATVAVVALDPDGLRLLSDLTEPRSAAPWPACRAYLASRIFASWNQLERYLEAPISRST
jgi:hypothetical protein